MFIGFSIMVSELTKGMDSRAASIVIGLSRLAAGVIFAWLSINIPQMMGVYYSRKKKVTTYKSVREVRFNLSWNLWMEVVTMFFLNFFFSCHSERFAVLYGLISECFHSTLFQSILTSIFFCFETEPLREKPRT